MAKAVIDFGETIHVDSDAAEGLAGAAAAQAFLFEP